MLNAHSKRQKVGRAKRRSTLGVATMHTYGLVADLDRDVEVAVRVDPGGGRSHQAREGKDADESHLFMWVNLKIEIPTLNEPIKQNNALIQLKCGA